MSVRDIPKAEWQTFLDDFSRGHRAWLATVDRTHGGEPAHTQAVERPLDAVSLEVQARVVRIEIRFQEDSHAIDFIRIDRPTRVRVDETAQGTARGLEIQDAHGDRTRIRFRVADRPMFLDGVAPGEAQEMGSSGGSSEEST